MKLLELLTPVFLNFLMYLQFNPFAPDEPLELSNSVFPELDVPLYLNFLMKPLEP
jgi:hypothetical protein